MRAQDGCQQERQAYCGAGQQFFISVEGESQWHRPPSLAWTLATIEGHRAYKNVVTHQVQPLLPVSSAQHAHQIALPSVQGITGPAPLAKGLVWHCSWRQPDMYVRRPGGVAYAGRARVAPRRRPRRWTALLVQLPHARHRVRAAGRAARRRGRGGARAESPLLGERRHRCGLLLASFCCSHSSGWYSGISASVAPMLCSCTCSRAASTSASTTLPAPRPLLSLR